MWGAAILDCEVGVGVAPPAFRVGNQTSSREVGISTFQVQMERTISLPLLLCPSPPPSASVSTSALMFGRPATAGQDRGVQTVSRAI